MELLNLKSHHRSLLDFDELENQESLLRVENNNESNNFAIAWINLTYYRKQWVYKEKVILDNLNGEINFGTLTALMGPSGGGKTTLLRCINGLNKSGLSSDSEFYVNKTKKIKPCFIVQDKKEHLLMGLTVKESLLYSSLLKNKRKYEFNHNENVSQILTDLLLTKCENTLVSKCSGGEQKRLTIGLELTSKFKPNLICIDEPTTGLDSNAAEKTIICLQKLCRTYNLAIVTSIHQPNTDVLMLFDHLYVLAKGGHCVFDGKIEDLRDHLHQCQIKCLEWQIPIEVLIKVASKSNQLPENEEIPNEIKSLKNKTYQDQELTLNRDSYDTNAKLLTGSLRKTKKCFNLVDFYYILARSAKFSLIRGWSLQFFQMLFILVGALLTASLYRGDIGKDSSCPIDILNDFEISEITDQVYNAINGKRTHAEMNVNYIFVLLIYFFFVYMEAIIFIFPNEIKIFLNEHRNGWYSTSSYYWARTFTDIPLSVLVTYLYYWYGYYATSNPGMTHWYNGIWDVPDKFKLFVLFSIVGTLCFQGLAFAIGIIFSKNNQIAIMISTAFFMASLMFTDFFIPVFELSGIIQSIASLSFVNLLFRSYNIILYGDDRCDDAESRILSYYRNEEDQLWTYFSWLIYQAIFWRLVGFVSLIVKSNQESFGKKSKSRNKGMKYQKTLLKNNCGDIREEETAIEDNLDVEKGLLKGSSNSDIKFDHESLVTLPVQKDLSSKQFALGWINLTFSKKSLFKKEKIVLNNLKGQIYFGTLTGLMGPSGAGKTSLLRCINGLNNSDLSNETEIYISKETKIRPCFIVQDHTDHLLMNLTVFESLMYSSLLKNQGLKSDVQVESTTSAKGFHHKENVRKLLSELMLLNCSGNLVSKCSGGEQKRLSIGLELTPKIQPNLMCIDEPTSGLDSYAAEQTIICLRNLAENHNIAIVTSIHQPNTDILLLFDQLYVLSKDGLCVFNGDPLKIRQHLLNCQIPCLDWQIPIEVLIKVSSKNEGEKKNNAELVNNLVDKTKEELSHLDENTTNYGTKLTGSLTNERKMFNFVDFFNLLCRTFQNTILRKWKLQIGFAIAVVMADLTFLVLFPNDIGTDSGCAEEVVDLQNISLINQRILDAIIGNEQKFQQNMKLNYFIIKIIDAFVIISGCVTFTSETNVFLNEHRNHWYSTGSYFLAKNIAELPILLFIGYIYFFISYFGVSQPDVDYWYQAFWNVPERFQLYAVFLFLELFNLQGMTMVFSIICSGKSYSFQKAITMSVSVIIVMSLFSGFFVPVYEMNPVLQLLAQPNFFRLAIESVTLILYKDRCETTPILYTYLGIQDSDLWHNFYFLLYQGIILRFIGLIVILFKVNPRWLLDLFKKYFKR